MKKFIFFLLTVLVMLIGGSVVSWTVRNTMDKDLLQPSVAVAEEQSPFGFVYLLQVDTNSKWQTNEYEVKIFDPATQRVERITKITLPVGIYTLSYLREKIFYLDSPFPRQARAIISLDLRTGRKRNVVTIKSSYTAQDRIVESFLVTPGALFYLNCTLPSGSASGAEDCRLERTFLPPAPTHSSQTLLNLSGAFKASSSVKKIEGYLSSQQSLILSEWLNPDTYTAATIEYYEVVLEKRTIASLSSGEGQKRLSESTAPAKEHCDTETLNSGIFEKERVEGVFPPQIRLGCFSLEELRSLSH